MKIIRLNSRKSEVSTDTESNCIPLGVKRLKVDVSDSSIESVKNNYSEISDNLETCRNSIDNLNHDCLARILMYLPAVERLETEKVSSKWKEATALSWYNVKKFVSDNSLTKHQKIKILKNCCQYLTFLTIDCGHSWAYEIIKNKCQNVVHFYLTICCHYDKDFYQNILQIISSMSKLKYFRVSINAIDKFCNPCPQIFEQLPDNIDQIHVSLNICADSPEDKSEFILDLPDKFRTLRFLTLRRFHLTDSTIQSILQNKTSLIYLDLSDSKFPTGASSMFSKLTQIRNLQLFRVKNLNIDTISRIAQNAPNLKYFNFASIIDDGKMEHIPYHIFRELKYLSNLTHLWISNAVEEADYGKSLLSNIANNLKLKCLNIGQGLNFSVPADVKEIIKLKHLEYLYLGDVHEMDSQSFIDIANNCLQLKVFDISFENKSMAALERLANLKKLKELKFTYGDDLTGDVIARIVRNCTDLEKIHFCECENVTEACLLQVGKLKYLKTLILENIENVPNAMFNDLHNLKTLICNFCSTVTDVGIMKVIDNCQNLEFIDLRGTRITEKTLVHEPAKRQLTSRRLQIWADGALEKHDCNRYDTSPHEIIFCPEPIFIR